MTVELLDGEPLANSHPYNGLRTIEAADKIFLPSRIDGLSDTQWDALRGALVKRQLG